MLLVEKADGKSLKRINSEIYFLENKNPDRPESKKTPPRGVGAKSKVKTPATRGGG